MKLKIEQRDLVRWFKKGWVYVAIVTFINLLTVNFGMASFHGLLDQFAANPTGAISGIVAIGILSLIWAIIVFPVISGFLIEEIDKRIRK